MDKLEFLNRLRMTLNGSVPTRVVEENLNYYENYINSQVRMGYSEEEVLYSLGDPRLIAKSIISANESNNAKNRSNSYQDIYEQEQHVQERQSTELRVKGMPGWLKIAITCLVIVGIIKIIATVVSVLLPMVFPVLLIYFLVKLFRDWLN